MWFVVMMFHISEVELRRVHQDFILSTAVDEVLERSALCSLVNLLLSSLCSRLKNSAEQEQQRAQSLSLDLQRKEDDANDLREKLADYKKQIQQVQKEVRSGSSTRSASEEAASPPELPVPPAT